MGAVSTVHTETISPDQYGFVIMKKSKKGESRSKIDRNLLRRVKEGLALILLATASLVLAEGLCSLIIFVSEFEAHSIVAERIYTEYEPLLGWVSKPNILIKDMYGPGKYLQTNSQSFRNKKDFTYEIPPGGKRWICTGDSFTFGYGVSNDDSWCAGLASRFSNLETVNMGQGGYGFDQAYLWYARDGTKFEHNVLLFAFITEDIERVAFSKTSGHKPLLTVENGKLVNQSYPVKKPGFLEIYLPRYQAAFESLAVTKLLSRGLTRLLRRRSVGPGSTTNQDISKVIYTIVNELLEIGKRDSTEIVLVHLPIILEYDSDSIRSAEARRYMSDLAAHGKAHYLDLIADFRQLDRAVVPSLFIEQDIVGLKGARGHYTEQGNRYIADLILTRLSMNPETESLLDGMVIR